MTVKVVISDEETLVPYKEVEAGWIFKLEDGLCSYLKTECGVDGMEFVDLCLSDGEPLFAETPEDEDTQVVVVSKNPQIAVKIKAYNRQGD